jgi:hypothetical protein
MPSRSAFAVTRSLAKAKARYHWAQAWVQVRGGIWCFESEQEARLYHPQTAHELFIGGEGLRRKSRLRRKKPAG